MFAYTVMFPGGLDWFPERCLESFLTKLGKCGDVGMHVVRRKEGENGKDWELVE